MEKEAVKVLIVKNKSKNASYHPSADDDLLKKGEEFNFGVGNFLYDLFFYLDDLGPAMDYLLEKGKKYIAGNFGYMEILPNSEYIIFGEFDRKYIHKMKFTDFIRVNNEFLYFWCNAADLIIFRKDGENVTVEGVWNTDQEKEK